MSAIICPALQVVSYHQYQSLYISLFLFLLTELDEERKRILDEREKWENEKKEMTVQRNEAEYQRAMASVDNQILGQSKVPNISLL